MANNWHVVVPEATINLNPWPSFEPVFEAVVIGKGWIADSPDNFAAGSTEQARSGACSGKYAADLFAPPDGRTRLTVTLQQNTTYTIHGYVYADSVGWAVGGDIRFNAANFSGATVTQVSFWDEGVSPFDEWVYMEMRLAITSDATGDIIIEGLNPDNGGYFYIDDVQIEEKAYPTTFCDGDQDGCRWLGTPHNSHSERDGLSAAGGRQRSLLTDFEFLVGTDEGTGVFPLEMLAQEMPLRPGDELQGINIQSRNNLLLHGGYEGENTPDYHAKRQKLIKLLNPRVGKITDKLQPRQLVYRGAAVEKEIGVYYVAGLGVGERIGTVAEIINGLQFYAKDPNWYRRGFRGAELDATDTTTFSYVARRDPNGAWDNMGNPSASSSPQINAFAFYGDYAYIAGSFLNFNGNGSADHIVRYDRRTGTYAALGTGSAALIHTLAVAANGDLYAGGQFNTIGGTSANAIARWNGTGWAALGTGLATTGICRGIAIGPDGAVYACGDFTTAGGGSANRIARWNGSSWSALGTGLNDYARDVAISPNGDLYVCGNFSTAGGAAAAQIARWDGSAWAALGTGISGADPWSITVADDGRVYVGGQFTAAGGVTVNRIAMWNGSMWSGLGGGADNDVYKLLFHDGQLFAGGSFTQIGDISTADRVAKWNGTSWSRLDINLPGSPTVFALGGDSEGYLYVGFNTTGSATHAAQTTTSYEGTERAYPFFRILNRDTTVRARLVSIRNETTDANLFFDYDLLPGESLFIDLRPGRTAVISSMLGSNPKLLLPDSDVASFFLTPGNTEDPESNLITCFVDYAGAFLTPSVVMYWQDTYQSYD